MKYINSNKINNFEITKNNFYVILDFDKTITSKDSVDSWAASANPEIVGTEIVQEMDFLYNKYKYIELDYSMNKKEKEKHIQDWYNKCIELYYKYNIMEDDLKKSISKSNLIFREGFEEFLKNLKQKNIPVIILSAGIGNVIEEFLKSKHCLYSNIYIISNFIKFNEDGSMKNISNNIIHSMNKFLNNYLPKQIHEKLQLKKYKILVGDLIEDCNMINKEHWDTTMKIGFLESNEKENLEFYNESFDIVLTGKDASFDILNKLILKI